MPIFEFKCADCGKEYEELVFGQDENPPCPKCGSENTAKLMSCCRHKSGGGGGDYAESAQASSSGGSSGCAGCSGGNCSSCG